MRRFFCMRRQKPHLLASGAALGADLTVSSGSAAAPSQPVNVTNTPLPVRVASLPLAVSVVPGKSVNAFNQVSDAGNQVFNHVFTIPTGKRLLIDYVSAQGTVPAGDAVFAIQINNPVVHFFVVNAQGTDLFGKSVFTAAQSLRATIGPFPVPTDVIVRMERKMFGPGTAAELAVTLAGQLVDP
jgi:hypothetical protein